MPPRRCGCWAVTSRSPRSDAGRTHAHRPAARRRSSRSRHIASDLRGPRVFTYGRARFATQLAQRRDHPGLAAKIDKWEEAGAANGSARAATFALGTTLLPFTSAGVHPRPASGSRDQGRLWDGFEGRRGWVPGGLPSRAGQWRSGQGICWMRFGSRQRPAGCGPGGPLTGRDDKWAKRSSQSAGRPPGTRSSSRRTVPRQRRY